jgi:hypothetical protein
MREFHRGVVAVLAASVLTWGLAVGPAAALVNLELRPATQTVKIGLDDTVGVGLYAVSDDETVQLLVALEAVIAWQPEFLQLTGLDETGGPVLISSDFPTSDPSGLNESNPPQNGEGLYVAWTVPGDPVAATPEGTLITTFVFTPLAPATGAAVDLLVSAGSPPTDTIVFDGTVPNLDVTGSLTGASVDIELCCTGDANADCTVDVADFLLLLATWGPCPDPDDCRTDLDGSGTVDVADFLEMLAVWGPCP